MQKVSNFKNRQDFSIFLLHFRKIFPILLSVGRKEMKAIYKTIDEIRKDLGFTQDDFSKNILGCSTRTYFNMINEAHGEWKVSHLIKVAALNEGEVLISTSDGDYEITVKKA